MPTSADLLLDTSAAIALVSTRHARHGEILARVRGCTLGLAGHAAFETYSVLTRLPPPSRITADAAERLIAQNFPASATLQIPVLDALMHLRQAGVSGGAVYDGLVALAAREAGAPLVSVDERARPVYLALGVDLASPAR